MKYDVDIITCYEVEAESETEARIKAGVEDSNVQLDENGFRIDNYIQGIKYKGSSSTVELSKRPEPASVVSMPTPEEVMESIYRLEQEDRDISFGANE